MALVTKPNTHREEIRIVTVTPDLARKWLDNNHSNRNISHHHVNSIATDILNGDWHINGDAIRLDPQGNLLDGQHRLSAIIQADQAVDTIVVYNVRPVAQTTMDTGRKRTLGDALRMRGEKYYSHLASTLAQVANYDTGSRTFQSRIQSISASLHYLDAHPGIRESAAVAARANAARMGIPGAVAGCLHWVLANVNRVDADYFFNALLSDEGHAEGSPILAARRALRKELNRAQSAGVRSVSPRWVAGIVIKAWNKWRDGEESHRLRYVVGGANPEDFPTPH